MTDYIIPLLLAGVALFALGRRENVYEELLTGAAGGLKLLVSIVPALIALLTAVHMLRASGAMEAAASFLSPVFSFLGIPPETAALVLVRPISTLLPEPLTDWTNFAKAWASLAWRGAEPL